MPLRKDLTPEKQRMPEETRAILLDCMAAYGEPDGNTFRALRDRWPGLEPDIRFRIASRARYLSFRWEQDDTAGAWEAKDNLIRTIGTALVKA